MTALQITPRRDLDFGVPGELPRFWFGGDPFRSRLFDAHSLLTPAGEKFGIHCVRKYRDRISEPDLAAAVMAFIMQEGQHSLQHARFNTRFKDQGLDVDSIETELQRTAKAWRARLSGAFALAVTAATEHVTTVISAVIVGHGAYFADADPRMFALYAWHCAEELEHRSVCFDVMQKAAGVGYCARVAALVLCTPLFLLGLMLMANRLLRADGFGFRQRAALWRRGLPWLLGHQGLFRLGLGHYAAYFRPGFHPSQHGETPGYRRWAETLRLTGDPIKASTYIGRALP